MTDDDASLAGITPRHEPTFTTTSAFELRAPKSHRAENDEQLEQMRTAFRCNEAQSHKFALVAHKSGDFVILRRSIRDICVIFYEGLDSRCRPFRNWPD
jgi:hypothetical protein